MDAGPGSQAVNRTFYRNQPNPIGAGAFAAILGRTALTSTVLDEDSMLGQVKVGVLEDASDKSTSTSKCDPRLEETCTPTK